MSDPVAADEPFLLSESDLTKLPREATRGLFLAFCEIGDRRLATRCLRILPLLAGKPAALDEQCATSYLRAFRDLSDWGAFLSKAGSEWLEAQAAHERSAAENPLTLPQAYFAPKGPSTTDLGKLFVDAYLAGETEKARLLMDAPGVALTSRRNFPSGTSVQAPAGSPFANRNALSPMEAAFSRDDAETVALLAERPEWKDPMGKLVGLDYVKRQKHYGLERDFCFNFQMADHWAHAPKAALAIVAALPVSAALPHTLRSAFASTPAAFDGVFSAFGPAGVERALHGERSGPYRIGELVESIRASCGEERAERFLRAALDTPLCKNASDLLGESGNPWARASNLAPLYFSESHGVRSAIRESAGLAPMASFGAGLRNAEPREIASAIPKIIAAASAAGDMAALRAFLDGIGSSFAFFRRESDTATTGFCRAVEAGSPAAIREILDWAKTHMDSGSLYAQLRQEGWILESLGLRKKGDALAAAIGSGDPGKAEALLEAFPTLDKSRAKETLKYLRTRDSEAMAKSLSAFESLLLGKALSIAEPPAKPKASRGI